MTQHFDKNYKDTYTMIELTDYCNLKCPMCSHVLKEGPHSSPQGFMDFDLYLDIIRNLSPKNEHHGLKLFWLGESFMHPQFHDILKETYIHLSQKKYRFEYIDIHTNGHFLTNRNMELLLQIGEKLPRITFSLDAVSSETHKKIRRNGNISKVNSSIREFLKKRIKNKKTTPSIILQFIIMPENSKDAEPFVKYWTDFIDNEYSKISETSVSGNLDSEQRFFKDVIWLKRVDCAPRLRDMAETVYRETIINGDLYPEESENWEIIAATDNLWSNQRITPESKKNNNKIRKNKEINNNTPTGASLGAPRELIDNASSFNKEDDEKLKENQSGRRPCSGPFKTPCIRWDGELAVCCFDPSMQIGLGNIKDSSFEDLWYGEKANKIRLAHITGDFHSIKTEEGFQKCSRCSGYDTPVISDEEIKIFLKWCNREELYESYLKRIYGDAE